MARRVGVLWDEDNLIYNESLKEPTMKIDEPPTPYNRDYDSADDADDESEGEKKDSENEGTDIGSEKENQKSPREKSDARLRFQQIETALEETKNVSSSPRPRFFSSSDEEEPEEPSTYWIAPFWSKKKKKGKEMRVWCAYW